MKQRVVVIVALLFVACGGQAPGPVAPATPPAHDGPALPKALGKPRITVEYVVIHQRWVENTMTPDARDVGAWYETPEGKAAVPARRRSIDFVAKKKAETALVRLKKGDAFEKVAETADVVSTKDDTKIDTAYEKLALGETVLVEVSPGYVVILKKDRPTADRPTRRSRRRTRRRRPGSSRKSSRPRSSARSRSPKPTRVRPSRRTSARSSVTARSPIRIAPPPSSSTTIVFAMRGSSRRRRRRSRRC